MGIPGTNQHRHFLPHLAAGIIAVVAMLAYPAFGAHHGGGHPGQESEAGERGVKHHNGHKGKFAKHRAKRMQKELGLSDEQVAAMKEHREAGHAKLEPLYKALRENKQALRAVQSADEYDSEAVEQLAQERAELTRQMTIEGSAHKNGLRAILTPEQREKMHELRSSQRGKKQHRKRGKRKADDAGTAGS